MKLFQPLSNLRHRLTYIGNNQPLNFISILLLIALDIFVLFNIFQGLEFQSRLITRPDEKVPYTCQSISESILESREIQKNLIFDALIGAPNYYYPSGYLPSSSSSAEYIEKSEKAKIDPLCQNLYNQALKFPISSKLQKLKSDIDTANQNINKLSQEIYQQKASYDSLLLEKVAGQEKDKSIYDESADTIKAKIDQLELKKAKEEKKLNDLENQLLSDPLAKEYFNLITSTEDQISASYKSASFWYSLKKIAIEFVFLLPLLFFFYYLYIRNAKKENAVLTLVFAHLLTITFIPVLFKIGEFLLDIIPKELLRQFLDLLTALKLAALFNYILIILSVLVTIGLVYFFQKKFFSLQRLQLKRIAHHQCTSCGAKLSRIDSEFCYKCGEGQFKKCPACSKSTHKNGKHCIHCGAGQ